MRPALRFLRWTFWQWVFALVMLGGVYAAFLRYTRGLGGATALSNLFPWGLWIGFDVICGVGLAAGGFVLAASVHIFNIERYKPILRPTILTAFLGYLLVILALLFDLGRPERIWHALVMWNPHSVMFEVAWCVMLYTTVLALEFSPVVFERFGWQMPLRWMRAVSIPLVIAGVILSTLHQSSLGSLYLIVPQKLHPFWYSPLLPVFFFISAIAVGLAMTIFESYHSAKAFGKHLEMPLLIGLGRVLAVVLLVYLVWRGQDLWRLGALARLAEARTETYLFILEIAFMLGAMLLLFQHRIRTSQTGLYSAALLYIFGFITNRLNVSITGVEAGSGTHYLPRWTEVMVTLAIIALGFAIFRFAAKQLPIFVEEKPADRVSAELAVVR